MTLAWATDCWALRSYALDRLLPITRLVACCRSGLAREHMTEMHTTWIQAAELMIQNDPSEYIPHLLSNPAFDWGTWIALDHMQDQRVCGSASLSEPIILSSCVLMPERMLYRMLRPLATLSPPLLLRGILRNISIVCTIQVP